MASRVEDEVFVKVKEPYVVKRSDPYQKSVDETYEVTGVPYTNVDINRNVNENNVFHDILNNKKTEYILYRYLDYFKSLTFEDYDYDLDFEHVFFCFEMYPHIESILKHNVFVLGKDFAHTVVCCKSNESFVQKIVSGLNIKIVCLDYETVFVNDYNNECLSKDFYNNFSGKYLFFTNPGGLIKEKPDLHLVKQKDFCGNKLENNMFSENYSIRNKEACLKALDVVDSYKVENSTISLIKKELYLEKIPENIFFGNLLLHNSLDLANNLFLWKSYFSTIDSKQNNEKNNELYNYLEKMIGVYF
tara:strand:+ start:210 stop:1118 length:909 start_codon:yes stop_codon:yes gene_type:complete